ncbi:MAG: alpha/beta fold hydrolase, partial [Actinomycetota bacterium]
MGCYDEFGTLPELAKEIGVDPSPETPERCSVEVTGRTVSAIRWGSSKPEAVFLHGGGQNAHTWDATILALGRPVLAVDIPGHGHSSWRDDGYDPVAVADDLAPALEALAPDPVPIVGMSLGGLIGV